MICLYQLIILGKNYLILFESFNSLLDKYNLKDIEKENDIVDTISQIYIFITKDMKKIINYYYKIDLNSYDFFVQIFNNISKIKEEDLLTNFETQMKELNIAQNKIVMITNNKNNVNEYKSYRNSLNNSKKKNKEEINLRNSLDCMKNLKVGVYHRFYISPIKKEKIKVIENNNLLIQIPYIKTPSTKKYTLVLDLN